MKRKKNKIFCIIPVRYNSSRFPGKPLKLIKGISLLKRSYQSSLSTNLFDKIFIATDDDKIFNHAKDFCENVIMTSENCLNGTERIIEVIDNSPLFDDDDIVFNMQGDHPVIKRETIKNIIDILEKDLSCPMATAATPIYKEEEIFSSSFVKVVFDNDQNALYFSRSPIPFSKDLSKASYFYHVGLYGFRVNFLKKLKKLKPTKNQLAEDLEQLKVLENGYKIKVAIVNENPLGVDIPEDIKKVEDYLCKQNTCL